MTKKSTTKTKQHKDDLHDVVEKRFDREVKRWDSYHDKEINDIIDWEVYKRKEIAKKVILKKFMNKKCSILEIGCGAGNNLSEIVALDSKWNGYGVDISSKMIEFCKKKYKDEPLDFETVNIDNSYVKRKKFDVIILLGVVGYLKSNKQLFEHIHNMSKKDAVVLFTYGNKTSIFRGIRQLYLNAFRTKVGNSVVNNLRKNILGRKDDIPLRKDEIIFYDYSEEELTKSFKKYFKKETSVSIIFSSGMLGSLSLMMSKPLEKVFYNRDYLHQGFTKILVLKHKKISKK